MILPTQDIVNNTSRLQSIVIADDDTDDSAFLADVILELLPGVHISIVKNGQELLQLLESFLPDLLFLDLDMPCKNGLECLTTIRKSPILKQLPVVVFSSTNRPSNIEVAYEMGADIFMNKPSMVVDLKTSVQKVLMHDWSKRENVKEKFEEDQATAEID